jgi:hypothetical protein
MTSKPVQVNEPPASPVRHVPGYDPERDLAERFPEWTIRRFDHRLHPGYLGTTDFDELTIWVAHPMLQCQERVTIAHEIVHIERGDRGPQPEDVEDEIEREISRRLISVEEYYRAACWARTLRELSDELNVDMHLAKTRWQCFSRAERKEIKGRLRTTFAECWIP